jgi:hypothetical protein
MRAISQRWQQFFSQALYNWNGWKTAGFILGFSAVAAFVSALWFSLQGWWAMPQEAQHALPLREFTLVLTSYGVLFLLLNVLSVVFYVALMGWVVQWMGRLGYMPALPYLRACKLVLITGIFLLTIILVFGQIWNISFNLGILLMLVHAAWLRNIGELPNKTGADT